MAPSGTIQIFSLAGIRVCLHWSWLILLVIRWQMDMGYQSQAWNVIEFLGLFGIVLLHEFGHAFATRSVGGTANLIVLWPLGGVAMVKAPARPGAFLWSIAAGPLVNVALMPVLLIVAVMVGLRPGLTLNGLTDFELFVFYLNMINVLLLVFNMMPVYPLDGGQIFQSLLWFVMSRSASLLIAAGVGLVLAVIIALASFYAGMIFLGVMAIFLALQAYQGLRIARMMAEQERMLQGFAPIEPRA